MRKTVPFLNGCISFVVFITILALVLYMLISFVTGTYDVANLMFQTIFLDSGERQSIFNVLNKEFLHNIALLIILMKAYRVLVEYMRNYHIDIKYMVEIAIIASILELLFNYNSYPVDMRAIFLGLAVSFLAIYVFKHETLVSAMNDSRKEMDDWKHYYDHCDEPVVKTPKKIARATVKKQAPAKRAPAKRTTTKTKK